MTHSSYRVVMLLVGIVWSLKTLWVNASNCKALFEGTVLTQKCISIVFMDEGILNLCYNAHSNNWRHFVTLVYSHFLSTRRPHLTVNTLRTCKTWSSNHQMQLGALIVHPKWWSSTTNIVNGQAEKANKDSVEKAVRAKNVTKRQSRNINWLKAFWNKWKKRINSGEWKIWGRTNSLYGLHQG